MAIAALHFKSELYKQRLMSGFTTQAMIPAGPEAAYNYCRCIYCSQNLSLSLLATIVLFAYARANADVAQAIPEIGDLQRWTSFSLGRGNRFSSLFGNAHVMGDFG